MNTFQDEEFELPSAEAPLAGALALMTGYAQHGQDCRIRPLMAGKLVHNLAELARILPCPTACGRCWCG